MPQISMNEAIASDWDVIVVGSGPAGASAARVAADGGASVLLVDRAKFPRYKLCGGGLIGPSRDALPPGFEYRPEREITTVSFTYHGHLTRKRHRSIPTMEMISRLDFDHQLVTAAARAGAHLLQDVTVKEIQEENGRVLVHTTSGSLSSRIAIGADGSASRISKYVGARFAQTDLGLEVELPISEREMHYWRDRVHLDWGPVPGSYAWVFPKQHSLTVGVIMDRNLGSHAKDYLAHFRQQMGLSHLRPSSEGGHLTRCRSDDSPLRRGNVLLCGDAAGLLEPWTREGISFALRSGSLAGKFALEKNPDRLAGFEVAIDDTLGREMRAGRQFLQAYKAHPEIFHAAIATSRHAWRAFARITAGERTFADYADRSNVKRALKFLAG